MTLTNKEGQKVYYNVVSKAGKLRYIILAASGQTLRGRDGEKLKSRTFHQEHQVDRWLKRNGFD